MRNKLTRQIEWLKAVNQMLRERVDKERIFLSPVEESRPMNLIPAISPGLKHFNIVSYGTYLAWLRKERRGHMPKR